MAGITPPDDDRAIALRFRRIEEQIRILQQPTGTSIASLVEQVQLALANIEANLGTMVTAYLAGGFTTGSMTATGDVTANGTVTGATGMKSVGVYNTLVSSSPYKVQYVRDDGTMGYVPSSRRYKQDIETAQLDVDEVMRLLRVVTFRYIDAVQLHGEAAAREWGVVAEEVHELGLHWLVDYDEEGRPDGVKHERFGVLLILAHQGQQAQIDSILDRLDAASL